MDGVSGALRASEVDEEDGLDDGPRSAVLG